MSTPFPPTSRYYDVPLRTRTLADGTVVRYLARRISRAVERYRPLDVASRRRRAPRHAGRRRATATRAVLADLRRQRRRRARATRPGPDGRLVLIPLPLEIADDGRA